MTIDKDIFFNEGNNLKPLKGSWLLQLHSHKKPLFTGDFIVGEGA